MRGAVPPEREISSYGGHGSDLAMLRFKISAEYVSNEHHAVDQWQKTADLERWRNELTHRYLEFVRTCLVKLYKPKCFVILEETYFELWEPKNLKANLLYWFSNTLKIGEDEIKSHDTRQSRVS